MPRARTSSRGSPRPAPAPAAIPPDVTLVAVSKTVPPEALRDAVAAGLDLLGENRVQEAVAKVPQVPGARWHLVGPLQSNKAHPALEVFDEIESVDSVKLARRLDRLVPGDATRAGAIRSWSRSTSTAIRPRPALTPTRSMPRWGSFSSCRISTSAG